MRDSYNLFLRQKEIHEWRTKTSCYDTLFWKRTSIYFVGYRINYKEKFNLIVWLTVVIMFSNTLDRFILFLRNSFHGEFDWMNDTN